MTRTHSSVLHSKMSLQRSHKVLQLPSLFTYRSNITQCEANVGKAPESRRNRCTAEVVRSGPITAVSSCKKHVGRRYLLDHIVGARKQGRRHGEAECLCRLQVDRHLKLS